MTATIAPETQGEPLTAPQPPPGEPCPSGPVCGPCGHNRKFGWNGGGSHCRDCHRSWTSKREAHCATCHNHFSNPGNFDIHRTGTGCIPPADVKTKTGKPKLRILVRALGPVWVSTGERPAHWGAK